MEHLHNHRQLKESKRPTTAELIEQLNVFDGTAGEFLLKLLQVQCVLGQAEAGAILRNSQAGSVDVLAIYPQLEKDTTAPVWLAQAVEFVRRSSGKNSTAVIPLTEPERLYGQPARRNVVIVPVETADNGTLCEVFLIETGGQADLQTKGQQLGLTANLLSFYEMRLILQKRQADLRGLQIAMETLSVINHQDKFKSAAMALCNEVVSKWQCERVSLGFLKGRYVQLQAMSHTENFSRKMKLVQDIESAMEECLDQDTEVVYPADGEATYVSRAAGELSKRYGPMAVLSLPLRRDGQAVAVLTLEREAAKGFSIEQIKAARLTCELCTSRLVGLYEQDRWIGAKAVAGARRVMAVLVGPKHTWAKIAAVGVFFALAFLVSAKGWFRAEAPFVLEAMVQQFVPAPFDGYLKSVGVSVDDMVEANKTILAELDTAELTMQLAAAKAKRHSYLKQAEAARSERNQGQVQIAEAHAEEIEHQIELLQFRKSQAKIVAPISGIVVKGDLQRQIGAPVKTGDVLFEIASLESLRAELMVSEDQIADIKVGQQGQLAAVSYPDQRIEFVVERINPVAEVVDERNVFKVRVQLQDVHTWMRPGMEGVAKISIDKRRYVWIWTRKLVNWFRMKFWL